MNPRDSIAIATAALRWSTAYERRRAAGTQKRFAQHAPAGAPHRARAHCRNF